MTISVFCARIIIIIGRNVWVESNATILGADTVGENAIVGGRCDGEQRCPRQHHRGGVSAKVIRQIKKETI